MKKVLFIVLVTILPGNLVKAQEFLSQLRCNPQLVSKSAKEYFTLKISNIDSSVYSPLSLPFVEDFSNYSIYPDTNLWLDDNAFINCNFAVKAPTLGVATLDATDSRGRIYSHANINTFKADTLTSKRIRLDSVFTPYGRKLTIADSLYFSFFYQPGGGIRNHPWEGLGDAPENTDSLILEFGFYSDSLKTTQWNPIWSTGGMSLDTFVNKYNLDTSLYFRQIMIPIKDSTYFKNSFQFRFRNLASLEYSSKNPTWAGNVDFWNIDYIRLDRGRTQKDTFIDDIAFAQNPGSILAKYESMPWSQFKNSELKTNFKSDLINLSDQMKNASYQYWIFNQEGQTITSYDGGSYNIEYFRDKGYQSYAPHKKAPINNVNFTSSNDTVSFIITHLHREAGSGDQRPANDTTVFIQKFYNYYAYDDGSPEAGYTVVDINTNKTALALQFSLNVPDTLRAIGIYVNHVYEDANNFDFNLCVWDSKDNMPNNLIYNKKVSQNFKDNEIYEFQLFYLEEAVAVNGDFFIGYQINTNDFLNVGFDQNTNHNDKVRYFSGNKWHESFLCGTPLMRAYIGRKINNCVTEHKSDEKLLVYPNPCSDLVHIILPESVSTQNSVMKIYSISGQVVYEGNYSETVNVNTYNSGIYIIKFTNKENLLTGKFIVK